MKKILLFIVVFPLILFARPLIGTHNMFAFYQPQHELLNDDMFTDEPDHENMVGIWKVGCEDHKFPSVVSSQKYADSYRSTVNICKATQTISLGEFGRDQQLEAIITPFYIGFKSHNMVVDPRYNMVFVGDHNPWRLYSDCHEIAGNENCIFWLGDKHDYYAVKRALLNKADFMVQLTDKKTGKGVHFIFGLKGYHDVYNIMQRAANQIHYIYSDLHQPY